jgi:hypothetical protein
MNKRPWSVTVVSWLFIVSGGFGVVYHATEFDTARPWDYEVVWICFVRLLAVVGGVGMIRRFDWARWLSIGWMGYHVGLSAFHSLSQLVTHGVLLAVIAYALFRPPASVYFQSARAEEPRNPNSDGKNVS